MPPSLNTGAQKHHLTTFPNNLLVSAHHVGGASSKLATVFVGKSGQGTNAARLLDGDCAYHQQRKNSDSCHCRLGWFVAGMDTTCF